MDPITITTIVVKTTATCLTTIKCLSELQSKFKDAPVAIVSICSESTVLSASLSHIQTLLLQRRDLADVWSSRTELPVALDTALTGCMVVFSCLDAEVRRITAGAPDPSQIRWMARIRVIWNESKLLQLLGALRGQQTALNLLIQLLQMNALADIKQMLLQNKAKIRSSMRETESLRSGNPAVGVPASVYDGLSRDGSVVLPETASVTAASQLEFDFDDIVINSQAYRRVFAQAKAKMDVSTAEEVEGLIDMSDSKTIVPQAASPPAHGDATRDVRGIVHGLPGLLIQKSASEISPLEAQGSMSSKRTTPKVQPADTHRGRRRNSAPVLAFPQLSEVTTKEITQARRLTRCADPACDRTLGDSDTLYDLEGEIYCLFHYDIVAPRCDGCGFPVQGPPTTPDKDGGRATWHLRCLQITTIWKVAPSMWIARRFAEKGLLDRYDRILLKEPCNSWWEQVDRELESVWSRGMAFETRAVKLLHSVQLSQMENDSQDFRKFSMVLLAMAEALFDALKSVGGMGAYEKGAQRLGDAWLNLVQGQDKQAATVIKAAFRDGITAGLQTASAHGVPDASGFPLGDFLGKLEAFPQYGEAYWEGLDKLNNWNGALCAKCFQLIAGECYTAGRFDGRRYHAMCTPVPTHDLLYVAKMEQCLLPHVWASR